MASNGVKSERIEDDSEVKPAINQECESNIQNTEILDESPDTEGTADPICDLDVDMEAMQKAVDMVLNGSSSRKAASSHGLAYRTVQRYVQRHKRGNVVKGRLARGQMWYTILVQSCYLTLNRKKMPFHIFKEFICHRVFK